MYYKYVFCLLVYRNSEDLIESLNSIKEKVNDYKVIVVNSYYDEESKSIFENIAKKYNCDFINTENKGYGYGNNRGMEHALKNYEFDYFIVSNPDIIIEKFNESEFLLNNKDCVVAPLITTLNGKAQNPYWIKRAPKTERLLYKGQKKKSNFLYYLGVAINKVRRVCGLKRFLKSNKDNLEIFASHGSFVMFPKSVFDKLGLIYDENMFLFSEEAYLAHLFENAGIKTVLTKDIEILHKEDGSMKLSKIDEDGEGRKSIIYYYEKMVLNKQ